MSRPGDSQNLLTFAVSIRDGYALVILCGEGDVTVRGRLRAALTASVAAGGPDLVVDLSRLGFIDASCVHELWRASRQLQQNGGLLKLAAPQPLVARVLSLCGADRGIGVHDSVAGAALATAG